MLFGPSRGILVSFFFMQAPDINKARLPAAVWKRSPRSSPEGSSLGETYITGLESAAEIDPVHNLTELDVT